LQTVRRRERFQPPQAPLHFQSNSNCSSNSPHHRIHRSGAGLAQRQVSGGMTGLICVGDPRDSIVGYGGGPNSKIDVRYLGLKDIQLLADKMPEEASAAAGATGKWQKEFDPGFVRRSISSNVSTCRLLPRSRHRSRQKISLVFYSQWSAISANRYPRWARTSLAASQS
jgi:hypothetical protein